MTSLTAHRTRIKTDITALLQICHCYALSLTFSTAARADAFSRLADVGSYKCSNTDLSVSFLERISLFRRTRWMRFFRWWSCAGLPSARRRLYNRANDRLRVSRTGDGDESAPAFRGALGIYRDASSTRWPGVACN